MLIIGDLYILIKCPTGNASGYCFRKMPIRIGYSRWIMIKPSDWLIYAGIKGDFFYFLTKYGMVAEHLSVAYFFEEERGVVKKVSSWI